MTACLFGYLDVNDNMFILLSRYE